MDTAMKTELALARLTRLTLALGAAVAMATAARAQDTPRLGYGSFAGPAPASSSGGGQSGGPGAEAGDPNAPPADGRSVPHRRRDVGAYLEVTQVLSADLGHGGDTLTYTSVAAGVDGIVQTRRVT